jgi:hypothetical protein
VNRDDLLDIQIDESGLLTFASDVQEGKFGEISIFVSQIPRIDAMREEPPDQLYYYSFQ